jgi:hypothetical protein
VGEKEREILRLDIFTNNIAMRGYFNFFHRVIEKNYFFVNFGPQMSIETVSLYRNLFIIDAYELKRF